MGAMADLPEPMSAAIPSGQVSASTGRGTAESPSCPLLGLPDDRVTRFSYPSVAHRCHAASKPRPIDLGHQAAFCLVATFPECARYRAAVAPGRQVVATPVAAATPVTSAVVTGPTRVAGGGPGTPAGPGTSGTSGNPGASGGLGNVGGPGNFGDPRNPRTPWPRHPRRSRRWAHAVAVLIAVVVLAGAAYLASPAISDWIRQAGGGAAASSPSPSATPASTAATSASNSTVPGSPITPGSPTATTTANPTPTATVSAARIHVVVKGETLTGIAAQYGVTVTAIQHANGITDTSLIVVGEHLVIPSP
jgi:LysM repeat protein